MLDLYEELKSLIAAFEAEGVEYALCGGIAMAVHVAPRATVDIDFLMPEESLEKAVESAHRQGYTFSALPMNFNEGAVKIRRLTKSDPESADHLSVDFLLVTPETHIAWKSRGRYKWEAGEMWVVSREGLIALKSMRGSGQDMDDIKALEEVENEG